MERTLIAAALSVLVGFGCGGDNEPEPLFTPENTGTGGEVAPRGGMVHERGDSSISATVGPAGAVLELSNGAKLEIPAGALGDEIDLVFGIGSQTQAFANRDFERAVGPTLLIQPALVAQPGARIKVSAPMGPIPQPFTEEDITLATEAVDEMAPMSDVRTNIQTIWQYATAEVVGGRFVAEVQELPGMRVQFLLSRSD
jgi:hypothetical protein